MNESVTIFKVDTVGILIGVDVALPSTGGDYATTVIYEFPDAALVRLDLSAQTIVLETHGSRELGCFPYETFRFLLPIDRKAEVAGA